MARVSKADRTRMHATQIMQTAVDDVLRVTVESEMGEKEGIDFLLEIAEGVLSGWKMRLEELEHEDDG